MITMLRGRVVEREHPLDRSSASVVIDVGGDTGGVGYRVTVTPATAARLEADQSVVLHVHHHFWEADQKLFGFVTKDERRAFVGLLGAQRVGPALALALVATFTPDELGRVLATEDIDALCTVPGVGKKTAQRLLIDIKSSVVLPVLDGGGGAASVAGTAPVGAGPVGADAVGPLRDVREALSSLGYTPDEIRLAVQQLSSDDISSAAGDSGALLKRALRTIAGA